MNWLGAIVGRLCLPSDEILDLGCGIMQATGRLSVKRHVGVDAFAPYLDYIGPPSVLGKLPEVTKQFADRSFDVVLMLDVVEHLEKDNALDLLREAERIARRLVIVFTPDGPCPQDHWDAWGLGDNILQAHLSAFAFDELSSMGYACERYSNTLDPPNEIISVFAVKSCA